MLSAKELKLVIEKIPEMIKEALLFEPTVGNAKLVIDKTLFQQTDVNKIRCVLGDETARRKVCVTRIFYQDDSNRCYFTIKLSKRILKMTILEQNWGDGETTQNGR